MLKTPAQGQLEPAVPAPGPDAATASALAAELEALQRPASASLSGWRKVMMILLAVFAAPAMLAWWVGMAWGLVTLARLFTKAG